VIRAAGPEFQWNRDRRWVLNVIVCPFSWYAAVSSPDWSHGPCYMPAVPSQWESEIWSVSSGIRSCRLLRVSLGHQQGDAATRLLCPWWRDPAALCATRSMQCQCHCPIIFPLYVLWCCNILFFHSNTSCLSLPIAHMLPLETMPSWQLPHLFGTVYQYHRCQFSTVDWPSFLLGLATLSD